MHDLKVVSIALAIASASAAGQKAPEVLNLPDGRQIYVTGLRRWTVSMLQDSLFKYSPEDSLQSHACAAVLRYKLHFADAAATTLMMGPGRNIVFVDVREPQDSARVHYRAMALDSVAPRAEWRSVSEVLQRSPAVFRTGARAFLSAQSSVPSDTNAARVATFFRQRRSPSDLRAALAVLGESPNFFDRSVAALILANFPDSQEAWRALLDGMRETDGQVKSWSADALQAVSNASQVGPDWKTLAPVVHAILDGTSLFQLDGLIELLNRRPEIGAAHASAFLGGGGEMLVNFMQNPQAVRARPARALLVKLHGSDLGSEANVWRAWIDSLATPRKKG